MRSFALVPCLGAWLGCAGSLPTSSVPPEPRPEARCDRSADSTPLPTGAMATVCGDDLHGIPATQLESLLEGRVAGVQVVRGAGGELSIRVRGRSSIHGDNDPLYVVDGMPVVVVPGQGLSWLNPGDIERIDFLKDAGATGIYGMRGANGVVLITTRRGRIRDSRSR